MPAPRIDRRGFVAGLATAGLFAGYPSFAQAAAEGALPPKSPGGLASTAMSLHLRGAEGGPPGLRDNPVAYLEKCRSLGAGGIQHAVSTDIPAFRKRLDELGMYYEGEARLPARLSDDLAGFEASMANSAALGATSARAVSRPPQGGSGRRYETFASLADFRAWEAEANAIVLKCLPIAAKYKVAIALENHKDRTMGEHVAFLRKVSSEWLGALVDPGNNMSFMEDPVATVTALAPFARSCSLKDMGVAPDPRGFLLAEVPFGTGMTDQKALFAILRRANPRINAVTELITRDPLEVPVLAPTYDRCFEGSAARRSAWLAMVAKRQTRLPRVDGQTPVQRLALEAANNRQVMDWCRANLTAA